jgi:hypothetical protein
MQAKLNPQFTSGSSTATAGKLNFPGFQEILDFTSAGSESSVSVTVDGDTDKEYKIFIRNLSSSAQMSLYLNNDKTTAYGYQYLLNNAGSISAYRGASTTIFQISFLGINEATLLTPQGFIKTCFFMNGQYSSGTTMVISYINGRSYNSTSNITSLNFESDTGNFTAGTCITVYARRSNT